MVKRRPDNDGRSLPDERVAGGIRLYKSSPESGAEKTLSGLDEDYAEQQWEAFVAIHKEKFTRMAADALAEQSEGLTEDLDPETL